MTDHPGRDERSSPRDDETTPRGARTADQPEVRDAADEVPVPIVMSPAEVDERAQVVEALREDEGTDSPTERELDPRPRPGRHLRD